MAVAKNVATSLAAPNLERIVFSQSEQWLSQCHSIRQWYRQNFLLNEPTTEQKKLADEIYPWMIRITRALLSQMLDPQFPHRHLAKSVEASLWQLEEDWAARHNTMTEGEAQAIVHRIFPEDAS